MKKTSQEEGPSDNLHDIGPGGRVVAALLAAIWTLAGLTALWLSISNDIWIGIVLAVLAIIYGSMWIRVSYVGRKLRWSLRKSKN